jgi:integrating conjugative element protein (TIGR03765 family)
MRAFEAGWGGAVWKTLGEPITNVTSRCGAVDYGDKEMIGFNNIELITDRPLEDNFREIEECKRHYPDHTIIGNLQQLQQSEGTEDKLHEWVDLLFDQALLAEGSPIEDPAGFARRLTSLLEEASQRTVAGGILAILCRVAPAQLPVIYDSKQTESIAPYLEGITAEPAENLATLSAPDPLAGRLPVHTPELSPGTIQSRRFPEALRRYTVFLDRPLFLIGADPLSRQWLIRHRTRLAQIGAVGLLVEVRTQADLTAIGAIGGDLPIAPASASELAGVLGLRHYPVLISAEGYEQ